MARISFPEISDDRTELFGAAEGRSLQPTELATELIPVHQLHAFRRLREIQFFASSAGAGISFLLATVVPADRYQYVLAAHIEHTDPAARDAWVELQDPTGQVFSIQTLLGLPTNTRFGVRGPFIIPPKWQLRGSLVTIAAAGVISLRYAFLELNLQDAAPH